MSVLFEASGVTEHLPGLAELLLEVLEKKTLRGIYIGFELANTLEEADERGWRPRALHDQRRLGKAARASVPVSKVERVARLQYLRQELHHDVAQVVERCLRMAKRDHQLFRTRVM